LEIEKISRLFGENVSSDFVSPSPLEGIKEGGLEAVFSDRDDQ
jgi:hypothetical protein